MILRALMIDLDGSIRPLSADQQKDSSLRKFIAVPMGDELVIVIGTNVLMLRHLHHYEIYDDYAAAGNQGRVLFGGEATLLGGMVVKLEAGSVTYGGARNFERRGLTSPFKSWPATVDFATGVQIS